MPPPRSSRPRGTQFAAERRRFLRGGLLFWSRPAAGASGTRLGRSARIGVTRPRPGWSRRRSRLIRVTLGKFAAPPPPTNPRQATAAFEKEKAEAATAGTNFTKQAPGRPWGGNSELYNAMIAPLIPYAIKGAIWYQGESNAGRAEQYRTLFPDMIRCWRRDWGQGDFPFLAVQIAPWDWEQEAPAGADQRPTGRERLGRIAEAQLLATKCCPRSGWP